MFSFAAIGTIVGILAIFIFETLCHFFRGCTYIRIARVSKQRLFLCNLLFTEHFTSSGDHNSRRILWQAVFTFNPLFADICN